MRTFVIGDVHGRRAQLQRLIKMLPRDAAQDALVVLGDVVDRGEDVPGAVDFLIALQQEAHAKQLAPVVVLRGNHEQMMLDMIDNKSLLWLHAATGSERTFEQYTGRDLSVMLAEDADEIQNIFASALPPAHLDFFRAMPLFYEDELAIYVHAGLKDGAHPREANPHHLLWSRDEQFYKNYLGKLCVFGHTPVPLLPLIGRIGRHGIYVSHNAVGIDTGYTHACPLTCLELPDFTIYQTYADGRAAKYHLNLFAPKIPHTIHEATS
jgi:serine/threonine protein phosphatase 1